MQAETSRELGVLQHSLGLDEYGRGCAYRRHFVASEGHDDFGTCLDLVGKGFMVRRAPSELTGGDDLFLVTDAGERFARDNSPEPARLSRSQERYRRYLDADSGLPFGEWIRTSYSRDERAPSVPGDFSDVEIPF